MAAESFRNWDWLFRFWDAHCKTAHAVRVRCGFCKKILRTTHKSTTIHIAAFGVILAAFCLPAAELQAQGRGSPPTPVDVTLTFSGICSFDVLSHITGKEGVKFLPGGSVLFTAATLSTTLTNLSDLTKSVTLSSFGPVEVGPVQNGTITIRWSGRNLVGFPSPLGFRLMIGTFTAVIDANTGQLLQGPTGTGQNIDVCELIE
jgi:hypothetical protein